jgi:hypothetical protein
MAQNFRKVFTVRDGIQVSGESLVVANNRVGIGTSTPQRQAEVVGELLVSGKLSNTGVVSFRNLELSGITTFYEFDDVTGYKGLGAGTTNPGTVIGIGTSYAGIQTGATMQVGFGITLFANSGRLEAIAYHGDGSTLSNVPVSGWTSTSEAPPALVAANTEDIYRLASVGIGTTIVTHRLTVKTGNFDGQDVKGDIFVDQHGEFGGIVTALSYRGDLSFMSGIAQTAGFARTAFGLQGDPTIGITTLTALGDATINGKLSISTSVNHLIAGAGLSVTGIVTATAGFAGSVTGDVAGNATGLRLEPDISVSNIFAKTVGIGTTNTGIAVTTNGGVLIDGLLDPTGNTYSGITTDNEPPNYHVFLRNKDDKDAATIGIGFGVGMGNTSGGALVYEQQGNEGGNISVYTRNSTSARAQRRFTVGNEGNVGVGTSRPGKKLAVIGDAEYFGNTEFTGAGVTFSDGANVNVELFTQGSFAGILTGLTAIRSEDTNYASGTRNVFGLSHFNTSVGLGLSIGEQTTGLYPGQPRVVINPPGVPTTVDDYYCTFANGGSAYLGYQGLQSKIVIASDACIAFSTSNYLQGIVADLTPYHLGSGDAYGGGNYTGVTTGFLRLPVNTDQRMDGIFAPGSYTASQDIGFFGLEQVNTSIGLDSIVPVTKLRVGIGTTNFGFAMQYNSHAPGSQYAQWFGLPTCDATRRAQTDYLWTNSVGIGSGMMFFDQTSARVCYLKSGDGYTIGDELQFQRLFSSDDVVNLIGIATITTNTAYQLGTFTGSTISNNTTIKNALQQLETEVETKASSASVPTFATINSVDAITGNSNKTVDASTHNKVYWTGAISTGRTLNISNLTAGREMTVWLRNTGNQNTITVQASTTTSSYGDVKLADDDTGNGAEITSFTCGDGTGSNGMAEIHVMNIDGNFIGHVIGNV